MEKDELFERWRWMMDYCKRKRLPPAQEWAWSIAEMEKDELFEQWRKKLPPAQEWGWDIAEKEYQTANKSVQPTEKACG